MKKVTKVSKFTKPTSLKDMIDSTNWVGLQTRRCSTKLADDALSIQFTLKVAKSKKSNIENVNCDFVRIRMGAGILEKLDWQMGDRIFISNHPDDVLTFLLCKVHSSSGFRIGSDGGSPVGRLQFAWREHYIPVKASPPNLVDYEIHKNKLIFRANLSA